MWDFRDVIWMVYKMASVGSVQDNSFCEESTDNFVKKTYAGLNEMCKKNGISAQCSCGENPNKNYHPKRVKTTRLNGLRPSIPTLRSRTAPTERTSLSDYPLQKRRSPRTEKPDNVDGLLISRSDSLDTNCSYGSVASSEPPDTSRSCTPQPLSLAPLLRHCDATNSDSNSNNRLLDANHTNNMQPEVHLRNNIHQKSFKSCHPHSHTNHKLEKKCTQGNNGTLCAPSSQAVTGNHKLNKSAAFEISHFNSKHNGDINSTRNHLVLPSKRDLGFSSAKKFTSQTTDTSNFSLSIAGTSASCDVRKTIECDKVKNYLDRNDGKITNGEEQKTPASVEACKWNTCGMVVDTSDLMVHIRETHVESQRKSEAQVFLCLWAGCKVYNKPSCSYSWLERHVVSHSGDKPFKCIVDRCGLRFTSQGALERHINNHFNVNANNHAKSSRSSGDTPSKTLKKRKTRKRKSVKIKTDDFFDTGIMECVKQQVLSVNEATQLDTLGMGTAITFHSSVIARRTDETGKVSVLLQWKPEDILPDSWVSESQVELLQEQVIPLSQLPRDSVVNLHPSFYRQHRFRKQKRK